MSYRQLLFVPIFLSLLDFAHGTTSEIDSLRNQLMVVENVTDSAKILNKLAWEYRDIRPDSALYFSNQSAKLSKNNELIHEMIEATNFMGVAYRNLGVYSKAFEIYLEALALSEKHGDEEQRGYTLINLGNLFWYQTNFQDAIKYFIQALDQAQVLGDRRMQAYCYINLGRSYDGIAEFGQAQLYFSQAIGIRESLNDDYGVVAAEVELAETYRKEGNLVKARELIDHILGKINEEDQPRIMIVAYNILARLYLVQGKVEQAEEYSFEALRISKKVASRYDEKETLQNLSNIFSARSDFKKAFEYYVNFADLNQQLFSEENIRKIEYLRNRYEIEKQEAENEFLRTQDELNKEIIDRQQTIIVLSVGGILSIGIIAALVFRAFLMRRKLSEKISKQKDKIEKDNNTIQEQSKKLIELNQAKSRFFANISHDLRSPLSLILGNLEMIMEDQETFLSATAKKNLEIGYKNSKRLIYLTDEINDITKLEEGRIKLRVEEVRVNSYMLMLTEMFKSTADYKGVKLGFESDVEEHEVFRVDPRQFEKIFYNLVSNAIRHTHKGDIILIKARIDGDDVVLTFKDTGEGIPESSLPHIFDRFYQTSKDSYQTKEGLGIGLALVKDLIDLHDGTIEVKSEIGKGTEFKIRLRRIISITNPIVPKIEKVKEQHTTFRELETDAKIKNELISKQKEDNDTILIVDDHPEIRLYIRQILEGQYSILEAAHGIEAIDVLKDNKVDLIITDLMMPWMDGFELIESINGDERFSKIPLLVVSARISGDDQEKVLYKGINDYLHKPFSKNELVLRIDNLIKQKEKYSDDSNKLFENLADKNLAEVEKGILLKLETAVKEKISDPNLSVYTLTDVMAASERQVYRLVKKLTGLTPHEYITEMRMKFAEYLIRQKKVKNATEAARSIGHKNVTTFSKQFEKKFGVRPADLLEK